MNSIEFLEIQGVSFVGKSFIQNMNGSNTTPQEWEKRYSDGTIDYLQKLGGKLFDTAVLGWMGNYNEAARSFEYCIGVIVPDNIPINDDYKKIKLPDCLLAIGTIESGPKGAYFRNKELYESKGYVIDYDKSFEIEYFEGTKENGIYKYCTPVKKA